VGDWLTAPVALTLYAMGAVLVPAMLAPMVAWLRSGPRAGGGAAVPGRSRLLGAVLGAVFGTALGTAVAASVLVHLLGWWLGVPVAVAAAALLVVRRGTGAAHRLFRLLAVEDPAPAQG
jgi:hypothetical protein